MTTASSTQSPATQSLFRAAREGNVKGVHRALAAGADIEAESKRDRETPIKVAADKGHGDVVRALHAAGADYRRGGVGAGSAREILEEIRACAQRLDEARIVAEVEADPKAARALVENVDAAARAIPLAKERVRAAWAAAVAAQAVVDAAQAALNAAQVAAAEQENKLARLEKVEWWVSEVRLTAARRIVAAADDRAVLRQAAGLDAADDPLVPAQRRTM